MKVIEVVYNWPAETFIQRHIRALQAVPFPVQAVARHTPDTQPESASIGENSNDINAWIMPNFDHMNQIEKLVSLRYLSDKSRGITSISDKVLLGYFDRLRPDLIHFHAATLAALMNWIPRCLNVPYTMSLRGSDVHTLDLELENHRASISAAIENASGIHAVSHALGKSAGDQLRYPFDFSVIYTNLPVPLTLPAYKSPRGGEPYHFLAVGRMVWMKGFDSLLFVMRSLQDTGMNVRLTLVGIGPEIEHLRYLRKQLNLETIVDLPGKLSYVRLQDLFQYAHAYIQPSLVEGLSNSLAEATANGLPVFATDAGGTREVIEDGITGFLLPPLAPQEWAKKLLLVQDSVMMTRVRACAYDRARLFFSADRHAREFVAFYQSVMMR